jgi:hypothetical protein
MKIYFVICCAQDIALPSYSQMLINYRNKKLQEFADAKQPLMLTFVFFTFFNLAFALSAAFLTVYLEPAAASDGIAEIKGQIFFDMI